MITIPLTSSPSQTLSVNLGGQICTIFIYLLGDNLYMDLSTTQKQIISCVICRDRVRLVQLPHLGFSGDLYFIDTIDKNDPEFSGLGDRYELVYAP